MNNLGELEDNICEIIYILDEKNRQRFDIFLWVETGISYMSSSLIPNGM